MKTVKLLNKKDLLFYLDCTKIQAWQQNAGTQEKGHENLKIIKEGHTIKFESLDLDTPLILDAKILIDCIDSFHKIIFQELVKEIA